MKPPGRASVAALVVAALFGAPVDVLIGLPAAALAAGPAPSASPTPAPDLCSSGLSAVVSRPTQTTSPCSLKPGQVLLEAGYQTQTVDGGGAYTFQTVPNATLRFGTRIPAVEFDVVPPGAIRTGGTTLSSDVGAGLRWQIRSTPGYAYSVNTIATAPTGSNPMLNANGLGSSNAGTYVANANAAASLGKVFALAGTFSVASLYSGTRYTSVLPSLNLTAQFPAAWTLSVEGYRQSNGEGPSTAAHTWFDAAVQKDVGNAQFDVNFGVSNRVAPSPGFAALRRRYAGMGLSWLF